MCSANIFKAIGNGHPARVLKLACDSTPESVDSLLALLPDPTQPATTYVQGR